MSVRECRAKAPDRDHAVCLPLRVVVEDFCRPIPTRSSRKNSHSAGEACVACSTISIKAAASGCGADGYGTAAATGPIHGCLQRGGGYRRVTPRTELWALGLHRLSSISLSRCLLACSFGVLPFDSSHAISLLSGMLCLATGCKTEISSTVVLAGPLSIHSAVRNALTASAAASNSDPAVTSTECTRPPGSW
jgi:hypothetical protein